MKYQIQIFISNLFLYRIHLFIQNYFIVIYYND